MSDVSFRRYLPKLKAIFGARERLMLVSLLLVVPLLADRIHILETSRESQVTAAAAELTSAARRGAQAQRDMVQSVEEVLRVAAFIYVHEQRLGQACTLLNSGLTFGLRGLGNISVVGKDGRILCSNLPQAAGVDVSDGAYFHDALTRRQFVLGDETIRRASGDPLVVAAFPTSAVDKDVEAVVITSITPIWLDALVRTPAAAGMMLTLVDASGTVLATRHATDGASVTPAVIAQVKASTGGDAAVSSGTSDGRMFAAVHLPTMNAQLIVSIDERAMLAPIDHGIRAAYLQFGLIVLLVLFGTWFASERMVLRPIRLLAGATARLGAGDLSVRALQNRLPNAFTPLVRAFDAMAAQLAQRELELLNLNSQLRLAASVDALSGVANRRAFDNRLLLEWRKAEHEHGKLALAMIDIDHFKAYNDTYGHLDGDACLTKVGAVLMAVAGEVEGFSARYGGEEFSLLLPGAAPARIAEVGEMIRAAIEALDLPHQGAPLGRVTVSIGVTALTPVPGQNPQDLIEAADAGLYMAKRRGRNTVVEHGDIHLDDEILALAI